jgi:hypothetical protein
MVTPTKCPACGAVIEVQIVLGTDYSRVPTHQALAWKRSSKRPALSTIMVTPEILRDPTANQLYNSLRTNPNKAIKEGDVTFKLSKLENGTEFLQRWQPIKE